MNTELRAVVDEVLGPWFGVAVEPTSLWRTVVQLGWHRIGIDDAAGGVGGDLADLVELAAATGRHAVALPVIETALAGWALAEAGVALEVLGDDPAVVVVEGQCDVRFLPAVAHAVWVGRAGEVRVVRVAEAGAAARTNLADEPISDLDAAPPGEPAGVGPAGLAAAVTDRAALLRAAALGGCVERAARLVAEHAATREQFGRPLIAQQAVAHGLATIAGERDVIAHAVDAALVNPSSARCTAARAAAARSAGDAARSAHQLMGAMGITREHPLQLVTRRIWAWRDADGTQRAWEAALGEIVLAGCADDALWDLGAQPD